MKFLHRDIADIAVNRLRNLIPFDLAMMDSYGMILSSTNTQNVGSLSPAAQKCLRDRTDVFVGRDDDLDISGFYSTLILEDIPMGVIAVYSDTPDIEGYIKLTRVTAELLVLQENTLRRKQLKGQSINDFMHEWLFHSNEYSQSLRECGNFLGIHVNKPYYVVLFQHNVPNLDDLLPQIRATCLQPTDLWVKINSQLLAIASCTAEWCSTMISSVQAVMDCTVGIGEVTGVLANSLMQALEALRFGPVFAPKVKVYHYRDFAFIHQISSIGTPKMIEEMELLSSEGHGVDMIETLLTFVECNGEITPTAQALFIHRNTLKYRLDKIYEITKRDPQNLEDLFYLYTAVVHYLLKKRGSSLPIYNITFI